MESYAFLAGGAASRRSQPRVIHIAPPPKPTNRRSVLSLALVTRRESQRGANTPGEYALPRTSSWQGPARAPSIALPNTASAKLATPVGGGPSQRIGESFPWGLPPRTSLKGSLRTTEWWPSPTIAQSIPRCWRDGRQGTGCSRQKKKKRELGRICLEIERARNLAYQAPTALPGALARQSPPACPSAVWTTRQMS